MVYYTGAILNLHVLPVFQDGRQPWQEVFNGWRHLYHPYDIDNGLLDEEEGKSKWQQATLNNLDDRYYT